jgi:hypothetical protein
MCCGGEKEEDACMSYEEEDTCASFAVKGEGEAFSSHTHTGCLVFTRHPVCVCVCVCVSYICLYDVKTSGVSLVKA